MIFEVKKKGFNFLKLHLQMTADEISSNLCFIFSFPRFAQSHPSEYPRQCHSFLHDPHRFNPGGDGLLHVQCFRQAL